MKHFTRRIAARAIGFLFAAMPLITFAEDAKTLEWVVGYAAGGGSDMVARTVAESMSKTLGRSIVVNNKPGAATNIAADYVAKSKDVGNIVFTADFATLAANPWRPSTRRVAFSDLGVARCRRGGARADAGVHGQRHSSWHPHREGDCVGRHGGVRRTARALWVGCARGGWRGSSPRVVDRGTGSDDDAAGDAEGHRPEIADR